MCGNRTTRKKPVTNSTALCKIHHSLSAALDATVASIGNTELIKHILCVSGCGVGVPGVWALAEVRISQLRRVERRGGEGRDAPK